MADEVHELAVRITPEGADETQRDLDNVEGTFEEVAEQAGESAGELSDFAEKFAGAMSVAVAGLSVAVAGLLASIPVLGEAFGGLRAIVEAFGLLLDELLRPALGPLSVLFFELADAVLQTDGPLRDLLSILTLVGLVVGGLVLASLTPFIALSGTVIAIAGAIAAAIGVLLVAWRENFLGIRDITMDVFNFIAGFLEDFISAVIEGRWFDALGTMLNFSGSILLRLAELFDKFKATVRTAIETMADLVVNALKKLANRALGALENLVNTAISLIPDRVRSRLGISPVSFSRIDTRSTADIAAAGGRRLQQRFGAAESTRRSRERELEQQISRVLAALQNTDQTTTVELDGREVARNQESFLANGAANVGRVNRVR